MGPLERIRVVEMEGIGPGPFCAMLLGDLGAEVLRVARPPQAATSAANLPGADPTQRSRAAVTVDLKHPDGPGVVLALAAAADVFIEGYRPGVAERLGIGPDECMARNPALVYGRMTGWGQDGPLANAAGHDINYISLAGALEPIGRAGGPPVPPLNLIGDYGGGGMLLALGIVAALVERESSGEGQVVDAAMVDGASILMARFHGLRAGGFWTDRRGSNLLDTGAPFYDVYETADGRYVSVGSLEPQFFAELVARLGLEGDPEFACQLDRRTWPKMRHRLSAIFKGRTRDEWVELLEGSDACFAPVLGLGEAAAHPHNQARRSFVEVDGVVQPRPAPRFSRTGLSPPTGLRRPDAAVLLQSWEVDAAAVATWVDSGAVG